jgi:hypothetical protein
MTKPIKYTYLALLSQKSPNEDLTQSIATKFNELVMNDKEKSNHLNLPFFVPFLSGLSE